jgi:hypothetical protein
MEDERLSELSANTCADLLRQRYRLLLISQTVWTIVTRVVFFAAALIVAWMPGHGPRVLLYLHCFIGPTHMSPFFGCYNVPSHIISGQTFACLPFWGFR